MSRLLNSIRLDTQLQVRNQLYNIVIPIAILFGLGMAYFFTQDQLHIGIPVLFLLATAGTGYIFAAAMILFEKQEHTLDALVVTPLRPREYLNAKIISMTNIALVEGIVLIICAYIIWYGFDFNSPLYLLGCILLQIMFTIVGIIVVVRYDKINDFLMPSGLIAIVAELPTLALLIDWEPIWFYLIPTYPPLLVIWAAFEPLPTGQILFGIVGSLVWIAIFYVWAERAFYRHIIK
ncbi:MAG: hypothetical protein AAF633_24125 [Chloroflexota bacterium]